MLQSAGVPLPPMASTFTVRAVPANAAMMPSMKFAGVPADASRTRRPTINAVTVSARFVVKLFSPRPIKTALFDVSPA